MIQKYASIDYPRHVLVVGWEIDCKIIFLFFFFFLLLAASGLYSSALTMLFLECAVNNTKTLSSLLATDGFISQYKLFISLRSWKVILTWNKALLWSNSVFLVGAGSLSLWYFDNKPHWSVLCSLPAYMWRHTFVPEKWCLCVCVCVCERLTVCENVS